MILQWNDLAFTDLNDLIWRDGVSVTRRVNLQTQVVTVHPFLGAALKRLKNLSVENYKSLDCN
jgi:hypothetical protein